MYKGTLISSNLDRTLKEVDRVKVRPSYRNLRRKKKLLYKVLHYWRYSPSE